MPKTTFAGHPLHPQLVVLPGALIPFGFVLDIMHSATGKESYATAAYYSLMGGLAGGLLAGSAGAGDYLTIPPGTPAKKIANIHAGLNLALIGVTALNVALRRSNGRAPGQVPKVLSFLGALGVIASGWYGGHLVYHHGMRVGESIEDAQQGVHLPGDRALGHAFETAAEKVGPESGRQRT